MYHLVAFNYKTGTTRQVGFFMYPEQALLHAENVIELLQDGRVSVETAEGDLVYTASMSNGYYTHEYFDEEAL